MTEWSEADRTIALVWHAEQKAKCPRCGMWEWQADEEVWVADHYTCPHCKELDGEVREVQNSPGTHDGVRFGMFKEHWNRDS